MSTSITIATKGGQLARWLFLVNVLWLAEFGVAQAEQITSFVSDIVVQSDSSLVVTETITYDFDTRQRHGIFRNLYDQHAQPASAWYKERYVDYELISVRRNGGAERYTTEPYYDGLSIKIGNPGSYITGQHVYEIKYLAQGALLTDEKGSELYWNVTGHEWEVPILETRVVLRGDKAGVLSVDKYCYAGVTGGNAQCDNLTTNTDLTIFQQGFISPGEELTIAQSLNLPQIPIALERYRAIMIGLIILALGTIMLVTWVYRWRTKYKISRPVITQYEPYSDFKPMFTGVLFDNRLDARDISAGIVYLAQQGFISIKEISDKVLFLFDTTDYEVTLKRPIAEAETYFHEQLLHLLFGVSGVEGQVIRLSKVRKDHSKLSENKKVIKKLKKNVVKDMVKNGFLEQWLVRAVRDSVVVIGIFLIIQVAPGIFLDKVNDPALLLAFLGSVAFLLIAVGFATERRTTKGYEALNHLQGFKLFLKVTEKERYKFHNAPALSPQQFMGYLPYAIAFGVEQEWADVFKNIQLEVPGWYSSSTGSDFSASAFTTNLSAFSTSFSSSTGSSGSSGGGSSGGGSGGGGGGSW